MKPWQIQLAQQLGTADAPPVLTRELIARFARSARQATRETSELPGSSLTHWIRRAVEQGKLETVQRGLYLNRFRTPRATLADAVPFLQQDAIVSLNTVLGDAGVLNNPSNVVTAVVPIDIGAPPPARLGRKKTGSGSVHFHGMPRRVLEAGLAEDRLQPTDNWAHPRATPEKALLDWLYLGSSPRSRRTPPPRTDIDMNMLDRKRLARLARAMKLDALLEKWGGRA